MTDGINVRGLKELRIDKLQLPGDMKARQKTDNVKALQISFGKVGLLHYPKVRMPGYRVLTGGDRIAAMMRAGEQKIMVELLECTDEQAELITEHENLARRHDPKKSGEQILKALELAEKRLAPKAEEIKARGGGHKTAKTLAREAVANARNVKPDAVRKAEARHKERQAREQGTTPLKPAVAVAAAMIDTMGIELGQEWLTDVGRIVTEMEAITTRVAAALAGLTNLRKSRLPIDQAVYETAWDGLHAANGVLCGLIPWSLCPWCKGQEGLQADCAACHDTGYICKVVKPDDIPKELRDKKKPMVALRGKYVPLKDVVPEDDDPMGLKS